MKVRNVTLVYFSATDTTRKTLQAIVRGMVRTAHEVDFTLPADREAGREFSGDDFVLFGAPVYGGLLPGFVRDYLRKIRGNGTPCALVALYGNRAYEDALAELEDLVTEQGFVVIGAGAFVGEHSFTPRVAGGRPDPADLELAAAFGRRLDDKLERSCAPQPLAPGQVPGSRPYKERKPKQPVAPVQTDDKCIRCGMCAGKCPMGAIDLKDVTRADGEKCVRCLRCVRGCPMGAKAFTDEGFLATVEKCVEGFAQPRKEPELFL